MLETEFLFFQGMKKRIDQRISEGNYDEAAVSMQKCMEYILNSLDGRNNDYQKVCVLFEVQARVMENHPQYPFYWHEWETYDHCKIDILIEDTDSSLHYTHKCGNTTIGEEPEIPGMSCHSNDPKYREIIKCKDNEDAIECHCYMYRSENHPYPIPENTEDLLTMYSKRR